MKIKHVQIILAGLMVIPFFASLFVNVRTSQAQSDQVWSDPINLSNAGSSSKPQLVIDAGGTLHVIWLDEFDGYKYVKSTNGTEWTSPIKVNLPFTTEETEESEPVLLADAAGGMYAFWQDKDNIFYYSKKSPEKDTLSTDLSSDWSNRTKLADSVVDFKAVVSSKGNVHVGYISSLSTDTLPAGVYYLKLSGSKSSKAINLYSSQYFRSLDIENANIQLTVAETDETETVYMVWDDRSQKHIFLSKSTDGGTVWESPVQVSETDGSSSTPYNVNIGAVNGKLLMLWQYGLLGSGCTQYSQWSTDGVEQFGSPVKMLEESAGCPQSSEFLMLGEEFSVVLLNILDEISLIAWNGSDWSISQAQSELITFVNPANFETVIFGCQKVAAFNGKIFVVGCDKGSGGDIWFSSRSLGTIRDWFPPSSEWTTPNELTYVEQPVLSLSSVADENNIHTIWVQPPLGVENETNSTIQYTGWNGKNWSNPVTIISGLDGNPVNLSVETDTRNRLLLAWVNSKTGDMLFSWAGIERAHLASEWETPQYIPSISQANSSPDILVDGSGKILIAYAVSINEKRGIYFVVSEDDGFNWTQPFQVFDAASAGWDIVDQPRISLTGDGRLHVLFKQYSLQGEPRQSLGLYYSQSTDGGATWSNPEVVSENPEQWYEIAGYGQSTVHRLWHEYREAVLISFHQISQDGGLTWDKPVIVSSLSANTSPTTLTTDIAGNLHFFQLASKDDQISLAHRMWDGTRWVSQESKEIFVQDRGVPSAIAASISPGGNLLVSILVDYPYLTDEVKTSIFRTYKSLQLPSDIQPPEPAIIPAVVPTAIESGDVSGALQQPTQVAPRPNARGPISLSKNEFGLLMVGGLLVLISLLVWPLFRKRDKSKEISR